MPRRASPRCASAAAWASPCAWNDSSPKTDYDLICVMAGLVPAIHVSKLVLNNKVVRLPTVQGGAAYWEGNRNGTRGGSDGWNARDWRVGVEGAEGRWL